MLPTHTMQVYNKEWMNKIVEIREKLLHRHESIKQKRR